MEKTDNKNGMVPHNDGKRPGRNGGRLNQPWQKGQSGNPDGMKKGTIHLATIMRRLLEEEVVVNINEKSFVTTRAQALMLEKIRLATSSEHDAIRLRAIIDIEDRMDGRVPQSQDSDGVKLSITQARIAGQMSEGQINALLQVIRQDINLSSSPE